MYVENIKKTVLRILLALGIVLGLGECPSICAQDSLSIDSTQVTEAIDSLSQSTETESTNVPTVHDSQSKESKDQWGHWGIHTLSIMLIGVLLALLLKQTKLAKQVSKAAEENKHAIQNKTQQQLIEQEFHLQNTIEESKARKETAERIQAELTAIKEERDEVKEKLEETIRQKVQGEEEIVEAKGKIEEVNQKLLEAETEIQELAPPVALFEQAKDGFQQSLASLAEEGMENDLMRIPEEKGQFNVWKEYLVQLTQDFENMVIHGMTKVLDDPKYFLTRDRKQLVFPFDKKERLKNEKLAEQLTNVFTQKTEIETIPNVNVRRTGIDEYRLEEENVPDALRNEIKHSVDGIRIGLRSLVNGRIKLLSLLSNTLEKSQGLQEYPKELSSSVLFEILWNEDLSHHEKQEQLTAKLKTEGDEIVQYNYKLANALSDMASWMEKKYFKLVQETLLKTINDLYRNRTALQKEREGKSQKDAAWLDVWQGIYPQLIQTLERYLKDRLHIQRIDTKVGDHYNPDVHRAVMETVKDPALEDGQIQHIEGYGYQYDHNKRIIVKEVDVIVVKN